MFSVGETLTLLRRYEEGRQWLERTVELRPDFGLSYQYLATNRLLAAGDTAAARSWLERQRDLRLPEDINDISLVWLYIGVGDLDRARTELRSVPQSSDTQFAFRPVAMLSGMISYLEGDSAATPWSPSIPRDVELEERIRRGPRRTPDTTRSLAIVLRGARRG